MTQIRPTSVQDLLRFFEDQRVEIENCIYDILIEGAWALQALIGHHQA